jgi:hypothetical protein
LGTAIEAVLETGTQGADFAADPALVIAEIRNFFFSRRIVGV